MSEIEKLGKIMLNYLSGIIFIYFFAELDIFSPENYKLIENSEIFIF